LTNKALYSGIKPTGQMAGIISLMSNENHGFLFIKGDDDVVRCNRNVQYPLIEVDDKGYSPVRKR